jgi:hypothetical protein
MTRFDLDEILRRELHTAAESIEPAADGLNRIRERMSAPRPLPVAWLMVRWTSVGQPALLRIDEVLVAFGEWLRAMLRPVLEPLHPAAERLRPMLQPAWSKARALLTPRTESGGRPSPYAWLRPALAMAAVVAVAVAGGFALSGLPRQIQQAANSMLSNPSHTTKGGQGSGVTGSGKPIPTSGVSRPTPTPTSTCSPKPKPSTTPEGSPSPTPSPTPTPSPSGGASPTPTPSLTPTPTPSGSAGGDDPTSSSQSGSQSASDASDVVLTSASHPVSATRKHPTPSPSCSPGSG